MVSHKDQFQVLYYSVYFYVICSIDEVDVASFADNDSRYANGKIPDKILEKLEGASRNRLESFFTNAMKANPDKCNFLSSLDMNSKISASNFDIENTHSQKFLSVTIDRNLNFHEHVSSLCKRVNTKINAMTRVFPFMLSNKGKLITKAILMSQFGYCPLLWINHNRTLTHYSCLSIHPDVFRGYS